MGNDLARSRILFPFTPDSAPHRAYVEGINDCFMVIPPTGATGSALPFRDFFVFLDNLVATATDVTYNFKASSPLGIHDIPFTVTRGNGIIRLNSTNTELHAVLIVDSSNMYASIGTFPLGDTPYAEIEPAKLVWRTDTLTQISFINAYRHWNPDERSDDGSPFTTVLTKTGGPLKFESGYNVSLQYDEDIETLFVRGIPGAGAGLPSSIPWDTAPPATTAQNILNINGHSGNVSLDGGASVTIKQTDSHQITMEVV